MGTASGISLGWAAAVLLVIIAVLFTRGDVAASLCLLAGAIFFALLIMAGGLISRASKVRTRSRSRE